MGCSEKRPTSAGGGTQTEMAEEAACNANAIKVEIDRYATPEVPDLEAYHPLGERNCSFGCEEHCQFLVARASQEAICSSAREHMNT